MAAVVLIVCVGEDADGGDGYEEEDEGGDGGDCDFSLELLPALFLCAFCDLVEILERHWRAESGPEVGSEGGWLFWWGVCE